MAAIEGSTDPAADVLVEEAAHAAGSYRTAGNVVVGFLAAAPLAATITGILKLPEDSDWEAWMLWVAAALVVVAVLVGLAISIWLRAPVKLSDTHPTVTGFDVTRVAGVPVSSFAELRAQHLNLLSLTNPSAAERRDLERHEAAIRHVYRLATADELRNRVFSVWTALATIAAVACGAAAVVVLLLAPDAKSPPSPRLVSVTLTGAAQRSFGCSRATFTALRIGGTDEKPQVVTLSDVCSRGRLLELSLEAKPTARRVEDVGPLKN
jgi:hypothetical protein